jgi:hypothetical protein
MVFNLSAETMGKAITAGISTTALVSENRPSLNEEATLSK